MSEIIKYAIDEDTIEKCNKYNTCPVCGGELEVAKYDSGDDYGNPFVSIILSYKDGNKDGNCYNLKRCNRCGLLFAK